jgi:cell division protein FtsQ
MYIPFFRELEKMSSSSPELLGAISEIGINRKPFDGFDLVLYPMHNKVRVRVNELNEDMLRYTLLMVDVLASNENGINSFDFRSGIASYVPKEVSSE